MRYPTKRKRVRPDVPLLVGVGFTPMSRQSAEQRGFLTHVPETAKAFTWQFHFRTAAGRSPIAYATQYLAAAALALVTNGCFEDEQGDLYRPEKAMAWGLRIAADTTDIGATPFESWPPLSYEDERRFVFAEPIQAPPRQRPWWKVWA
jgi:hypothetical protein